MATSRAFRAPLAWLPAALFVFPTAAVLACLGASTAAGFVESPWPFFDGNASISRAGRHGVANLIFRATIIPAASALALFWILASAWLRQIEQKGGGWMRVGGVVGAVFLIVYASALGGDGNFYAFMRRIGIYVYIAANFFAQAALTLNAGRAARDGRIAADGLRLMRFALAAMIFFALLSLAKTILPGGEERWENIVEWHFFLWMQAFFLGIFFLWKKNDFEMRFAPSGARG